MAGQLTNPPVPLTDQFTTPAGAIAPAFPVTVAVIVTEPPRAGAGVEEITIDGAGATTRVVVAEATGSTAL